MSRKKRTVSSINCYHVVVRGNGKQIIFEDDFDRLFYLKKLRQLRDEMGFELVAYCLMENHVHLLIFDHKMELSSIMMRLNGIYSRYYNQKYERAGHLFDQRFRSEAIEDDSYFLSAIRYIHLNPEKAGICPASQYKWSSYVYYLKNKSSLDNQKALDMIGGSDAFVDWMNMSDETKCLDFYTEDKLNLKDDDAINKAKILLGINTLSDIGKYKKAERNEAVKTLRKGGLSIRQIERLTGISRGVIMRVEI